MRILRLQEAVYIDSALDSPRRSLKRGFKNTAFSILAVFLAFFVVASTLTLDTAVVAHAQEEEDGTDKAGQMLDDAADKLGVESTAEGFYDAIRKAEDSGTFSRGQKPDTSSIFYVFNRAFTPGYINYTPNASSAIGSSNPVYNCDSRKESNGTVVYHNCDVPNFMAEVVQTLFSIFMPSGAYSAEYEKVALSNPGFGLPVEQMPTKTVPVKESQRSVKYTGLELFGYNLRMSAYHGEWDDIKTLTSARLLSNFGLFDGLKLQATSVFNAVGHALQNGGNQFSQNISTGNVVGAVSGLFAGGFEGLVSGALNTLLDTSDLNVMNSNAWYRPGFGDTTYGARQLSQQELSAEATANLLSGIQGSNPDAATLPSDFPPPGLPDPPLQAISKCEVVVNKYGHMSPYGDMSSHPGISEADCRARGETNLSLFEIDEEEDEVLPSPAYVWSVDGTQKEEKPKDWMNKHSAIFAGVVKYKVNIPNLGSNPTRADIMKLYDVYPQARQKAAVIEMDVQRVVENDNWMDKITGIVYLGSWLMENKNDSFMAPHNQYVCVDKNGKDITGSGGQRLRVYNADGSLTGNCPGVRAPVQDGLFGNGYTSHGDGQDYKTDTRRAFWSGTFENIISPRTISTEAANFGLTISAFFTQVSNTAIGLAFGPLMEKLGITDRISSFIETLKDGLFMPLLALVVAFAGVTIFWRALVTRQFTAALKDFGLAALAVVFGIVLLFKPDLMMTAVDEAPAMVEAAVLGSVFNMVDGGNDPLCSATSTPSSEERFDSDASVRTLTCLNWKAFVFTPWVYGQWGTDFSNLYANGFSHASATGSMSNTNRELVGDAAVNFGDGQTINNWATYQLAVQASGTSTTEDESKGSGRVDPNWYRIADMQLGPNGGAGTDSRYIQSWSGNNYGDRMTVALVAPIVAGTGMAAIVSFAFVKVQVTFLVTAMLLFLPFMLLFGIVPAGRTKMKAYFGMLAGLMIQRVVLVLLMALLLTIMLSAVTAAVGYVMICIVAVIMSLTFMMYRSQIMKLIRTNISNKTGEFLSGHGYDAGKLFDDFAPKGVRNAAAQGVARVKGASAGAVGGVMAQGVDENFKNSGRQVFSAIKNRDVSDLKKAFGSAKDGAKNTVVAAAKSASEKSDIQQGRLLRGQVQRGLPGWQLMQEANRVVGSAADEKFHSGNHHSAEKRLIEERDAHVTEGQAEALQQRQEAAGRGEEYREEPLERSAKNYRTMERVRKAHEGDRKLVQRSSKKSDRNAHKSSVRKMKHFKPSSTKSSDYIAEMDNKAANNSGFINRDAMLNKENRVIERYRKGLVKKQNREQALEDIQNTLTKELQEKLHNIWGEGNN